MTRVTILIRVTAMPSLENIVIEVIHNIDKIIKGNKSIKYLKIKDSNFICMWIFQMVETYDKEIDMDFFNGMHTEYLHNLYIERILKNECATCARYWLLLVTMS